MTLQDFMRKVQQNSVCQSMLPVDLAMLYPAFSVKRGILCAHILCHRTAVKPAGLEIWPPELSLELAYPQAKPISIINLKFDGPYIDGTKLIPNRSPEDKARYADAIRKLTGLGDELLASWDENGSADISAYNECLKPVLDISQWEILAALAKLS